jgi:hypothetical protein
MLFPSGRVIHGRPLTLDTLMRGYEGRARGSDDSFVHLVSLLHEGTKGARWMAFIRLFLDESGHSSRHPVVVVAGFIGIAEAWEGFAERWNAILSEHGVVSPFSMKDFESNRQQFKGWDEETQSRPLMKALLDEICGRNIFLCGAAVSVDQFKLFSWSTAYPGSDPPTDSYHLAMQEVISAAIKICNTRSDPSAAPENNKLAVVLANVQEFEAAAKAYLRAIEYFNSTSTLLQSATFGSQTEYPQLQAADLAAFELRWRIMRPDIRRYPWQRILEAKQGFDCVQLFGIDAATVFPERQFEADPKRAVILPNSDQKRARNQGRKSRP